MTGAHGCRSPVWTDASVLAFPHAVVHGDRRSQDRGQPDFFQYNYGKLTSTSTNLAGGLAIDWLPIPAPLWIKSPRTDKLGARTLDRKRREMNPEPPSASSFEEGQV